MEKWMNDRLIVKLDETSSTNFELKQLQHKNPLPEGSIVMTDFQTAGRGHAGNSWSSERGKNLLFSFLLYPHCVKARSQFIISRIVSLAIIKVLQHYTDNITIKWPNDIYWNNKKIAGILIENSLAGQHIDYTIIGVGLNVNEDKFPKHLPNPVSLKQITMNEYSRDELLAAFYREFFFLYRRLQNSEASRLESEYMFHLYRKNGVHWFADERGRFEASIKTVMSSGHLVLITHPDREERIYSFKEVSFEI